MQRSHHSPKPMNSVLYSLCFATVVLWTTMSIPVLAQEPVSGSQGTPQDVTEPTTSKQMLNLHKVTLETKIKWSAQLLFYPKALQSIIALHAYKLNDICDPKSDLTKQELGQDLGFVVTSVPRNGDPSGLPGYPGYKVIKSPDHRPLTLAMACDLSRNFSENAPNLPNLPAIHGLSGGKKRIHLLIPFAIDNEIEPDLYWTTNLSKEMHHQIMKGRTRH